MGTSRLLSAALLCAAILLPSFAADSPATGEGCRLCLPAKPVAPVAQTPREARHLTIPDSENPHGRGGRCDACHVGPGEPAAMDVDPASCLECHEANAHRDEIHPTAFDGDSPIAPAFAGAPLDAEGRATCLTCHGKACSVPRDNREMLRGGPWPRQNDFCFSCHLATDYAAVNPHKQRDEGVLCWLCHRPEAGPDGFRFSRDLELQQPDLCLKCHKDVQHESEHLGRVLSSSLMEPAPVETLARFEAKTGLVLPLSAEGAIRCSTCHDPGPACGARTENRPLQPRLLRVPKEQICYACHDL